MAKLKKESFATARNVIKTKARPLEKCLFQYYWEGGSNTAVLEELKKYQNEDGGFGRGLEPDFRLPSSTPLATSIGLRVLTEIRGDLECREILLPALEYLETTFDDQRKGWWAVTDKINTYPHTPWWHFDEAKGSTVIDEHWGNPSAELLGYLYCYGEQIRRIDIHKALDHAVRYMEEKNDFSSEHELFCFLRLYKLLPQDQKMGLEENISRGISQVIVYDRKRWGDYVPTPLDFVQHPEEPNFGIKEEKIEENLEYLMEVLARDGCIHPPWGDSFYQGDFSKAVQEWQGLLTLEALKTLDNFQRLEL